MIIEVSPPEKGAQKTYSTAEISSAATSVEVENNDGFSSGDLILFGKIGIEKTEIVTATGVTGDTQVDHGAVEFSHPSRTLIQQVLYDQAEIYRASSEGGTYSLLTTIDLDVDEPETLYNDTGGTTSHWYKVRYKNSSTSNTSDYSDEVQGTGYTRASLRSMTDEVLEDFGDIDGDMLSRSRVKNYLNAGVRNISVRLIKNYPDYQSDYTTQALTSGTQLYSLPSRFMAFKRVDINLSGTDADNAYKAKYESETRGLPDTDYLKTDPRIFIRGSNFGIRPEPTATGKAFLWYWTYPSSMDNESDEHGLPFGAREVLVSHALYRAWLSENQEKAEGFLSLYLAQMEEYIEFVAQSRQAFWGNTVDIKFGNDLYE